MRQACEQSIYGGAVKLYHTTDAAEAILANGLRDSYGSYGLTDAQGRPFMRILHNPVL
jgi:hypothetical protein